MIEVSLNSLFFTVPYPSQPPAVQRERHKEDVHEVLYERPSHRTGLRPSQQKVRTK